MQAQFIISERGALEQVAVSSLRRRLRSSLPDNELADFAVRNLGCIGLTRRRGAVHMWLRPKTVAQETTVAAVFWLASQDNDRVVLSSFDGSWSTQIHRSAGEAIQALMQLGLSPQGRSTDFLRRRRGFERLNGACPLGLLLQQAQASQTPPSMDALAPILHGPLNGRFVLVDANGRDVLVKGIGPQILLADNGWRTIALGGRLKDMYDFDYGRWGAQPYQEVQGCREPMLEDIDVIMNFSGRPRSRYRYYRLILPVTADDGSAALLGASVFDDAIDLRI